MTQRKNKTNRSLVLPKTVYFTLKDVFALNKRDFPIEITVRVRMMAQIEDGKIAEIGSIPGGKGRPQKVFAMTPVGPNTLAKAKADGITPVDNADKMFGVVSVTNHQSMIPVSPLAPSSKLY